MTQGFGTHRETCPHPTPSDITADKEPTLKCSGCGMELGYVEGIERMCPECGTVNVPGFPPEPATLRELRVQLATIEHERWADWQQWMHDQAKRDVDSKGMPVFSFTIEQIKRWSVQIETPYAELSEREQASDMEQVDRYWPLIEQYVEQEANKARREEVEQLEFVDWTGYDPYVPARDDLNELIDPIMDEYRKIRLEELNHHSKGAA